MCVYELWKYDIRCAISCCCHHITRAAVRFAEKLLCAPENRRGARVALYYYCRTQNARAFSNNAMMHSRVPFGGQKKKKKLHYISIVVVTGRPCAPDRARIVDNLSSTLLSGLDISIVILIIHAYDGIIL